MFTTEHHFLKIEDARDYMHLDNPILTLILLSHIDDV